MACCLALALLIGALRTAWFRIVRRTEPPRPGFAPPGRRPAPGGGRPVAPSAGPVAPSAGPVAPSARPVAPSAGPVSETHPVPTARRAGGRSSAVLTDLGLGALIGAGGYAALLTLLAAAGAVATTAHPVRSATLIGAALAAAVLRARRPAGSRPGPVGGSRTGPVAGSRTGLRTGGAASSRAGSAAGSRTGRARELAAGGAAWSLLSVLDMHVTGLVPEHLVGPLADLALHGPGFLALTVGGAALLAGPRYLSTLPTGGSS